MRKAILVALATLLIGVAVAPVSLADPLPADAPVALTVETVVVNDDFGEAVASDFTTTVVVAATGRVVEVAGSETGTKVFLNPGDTYAIAEDGAADPGYDRTLSADCSGTTAAGEPRTCTVTFDDVTPALVVEKEVVNDDGGGAIASDFTIKVAQDDTVVRTFAGAEAPATPLFPDEFEPGEAYRVSESGPSGYATSFSPECSGMPEPGATRTCTITNDDIPGKTTPTLIVKKHVVNDDFGEAVAADFTMVVTVRKAARAERFPGSEAGTRVFLRPGDSYRVTETRQIEGYDQTLSKGCSGKIKAGQTKICTVTNDDSAPALIVFKQVINDDDGSAEAADFTMSVVRKNRKGREVRTFAGSELGTPVYADVRDLRPGDTYRVEESGPSGYATTVSEGCTGKIERGETKTCVVTNDDVAGQATPRLVVQKQVVNDDFGEAVAADFTMVVVVRKSGRVVRFPGSDTGTAVFLNPGDTYSVHETSSLDLGYDQSFSEECSGTIAAGETKTCTVTNDDITPVLVVEHVVINDDGGEATAADFTTKVVRIGEKDRVVRKFPGSEAGTPVFPHDLRLGEAYRVEVSGPFGYATSFSDDCTGTIESGEKTCTITHDDPA